MKILYFDTCFDKAYIVLNDGGKQLSSKVIESTERNYHSAYLVSEICSILKENGLFVKDLNAIGFNKGPGSFTGIRASCVIARVFAQQFNIKLLGISSLEILPRLQDCGYQHETAAVLDARRHKAYFGLYKNGIEITAPCLKDIDELPELINKDTVVISDSAAGAFLLEKGISSLDFSKMEKNLGQIGMNILLERLKDENSDFDWAKVKPLYLQQPSITMPKQIKGISNV